MEYTTVSRSNGHICQVIWKIGDMARKGESAKIYRTVVFRNIAYSLPDTMM